METIGVHYGFGSAYLSSYATEEKASCERRDLDTIAEMKECLSERLTSGHDKLRARFVGDMSPLSEPHRKHYEGTTAERTGHRSVHLEGLG